MLRISMLRVALVSVLASSSITLNDTHARAATIFLSTQPSLSTAAGAHIETATSKVPHVAAVSRASILPILDSGPALWSLATGGFALIGMTMRRRRRMPSVTS